LSWRINYAETDYASLAGLCATQDHVHTNIIDLSENGYRSVNTPQAARL
jgi:hypothetical protein